MRAGLVGGGAPLKMCGRIREAVSLPETVRVSVSQRVSFAAISRGPPLSGHEHHTKSCVPREVTDPNPFDVGRNPTSPGSNTDLLKVTERRHPARHKRQFKDRADLGGGDGFI
ncbi:hypothetical protein [Robiginitomaculum antarcticum]|uniref:hypothetical protein n=1 Tax=Robiginitomaculum antarcticum TaxID=437507 RepID=UPI0012EA6D29|nr:hypothetical protein [Robiginitomaculum antarcticum]